MDDIKSLQNQTYAWGRAYAIVAKAHPKLDTPARIGRCSMSPLEVGGYIRLAKAAGRIDEATDRKLMEVLGEISPAYPSEPIQAELQGSFWLGYEHERARC